MSTPQEASGYVTHPWEKSHTSQGPHVTADVATLYLIVGGLVFLLGIVILREAPREKANRATALMLFFGGLGSVLGAIGFIVEGTGQGARPGSTDVLRSSGGWDETLAGPEDQELWLRLGYPRPAVFVPEAVVEYRLHGPPRVAPDNYEVEEHIRHSVDELLRRLG